MAITKEEGELFTWGEAFHGKLGGRSSPWADVPLRVYIPAENRKVIAAVTGSNHTLVMVEECIPIQ